MNRGLGWGEGAPDGRAAVFRRHVGGMTAAGLTAVDLGKKESIGGVAAEFLDRMGKWSGFRPSQAIDAKVPVRKVDYPALRALASRQAGARMEGSTCQPLIRPLCLCDPSFMYFFGPAP